MVFFRPRISEEGCVANLQGQVANFANASRSFCGDISEEVRDHTLWKVICLAPTINPSERPKKLIFLVKTMLGRCFVGCKFNKHVMKS